MYGLTRATGFAKSWKKSEKIDSAWIRRLALNFEKKISKNAELRAKFEDDPQKYVLGFSRAWWVRLTRFVGS